MRLDPRSATPRSAAQATRVLVTLALVLGLSLSVASGQVNVVPSDVQMPGTQPGEVTNLQSPTKCDNCHGGYDPVVEPAHGWRGSLMSHATRDPLFWATVAVAEQDFAGSGDLCLRCHTPTGWLGGNSTPTDGSGLGAGDVDGVTCDLCHRMTNPDTSEFLGVQNAPFLAHDGETPPEGFHGSGMVVMWPSSNEKFGPYDDAVANHGFFQAGFMRQAAMCGTCHDVSNPVVGDLAPGHGAQLPLEAGSFLGTPGGDVADKAAFNNPPYRYGVVERTFSEHQASAFADLRVADYPALPAELRAGAVEAAYLAALASNPDPLPPSRPGDYLDGTPRLFTCQTCHMAPITGVGCNKTGVPVRSDLPRHDLTGGSTWMPEVLAHMDAQDQLVAGGGLTADELAALADGALRARGHLATAAALEVDGDVLRVVNLTGHKLISGYPEGRRLWLDVRWFDGQGALLREDGAYGEMTVDVGGEPTVVESLLDPADPRTRVYEAKPGLSQEWAAALVGLGYPTGLPLTYDRVTGLVTGTLGELAASPPGTAWTTFHFVLNDVLVSDDRIPPYGLRYDDALERSCLPVPASLYGDPGPGGVYDHWDELTLEPPAGAVAATVDLLYQSTSWEYVQFLSLANDGSVTHLASTGDDFLDAWLATGMAPPELVASTTWTGEAVEPPPVLVDGGTRVDGATGRPGVRGPWTDPPGTPLLPGSGAVLASSAASSSADASWDTADAARLVVPAAANPGGDVSLVLLGARAGDLVTLVLDGRGPGGGALPAVLDAPELVTRPLEVPASGTLVVPLRWPSVGADERVAVQAWVSREDRTHATPVRLVTTRAPTRPLR